MTVLSAGGGGWGDPLGRDPDAVAEDILNEMVSVEKAREDYGVVVVEGAVDRDATEKLRTTMRSSGSRS